MLMARLMMPIKKIDFENKTDACIYTGDVILEDLESQSRRKEQDNYVKVGWV